MKRSILIAIILALFFFSNCKRNRDKDSISQENINGMVYNQCTDSGLAGVTVNLQVLKDNSEVDGYQTISGANGNFSFNSIGIHSDSRYTYAINIPSKSGANATTPEYCGFNGTIIYFTKDEISNFFQPKVTPKFLTWCFVISPTISIIFPDSICVSFQQNVFHKNSPNLPYSSKRTTLDLQNGFNDCTFGNYPMGLWNLIVDKWKSGIHTTLKDSVYLNFASLKTYTINW